MTNSLDERAAKIMGIVVGMRILKVDRSTDLDEIKSFGFPLDWVSSMILHSLPPPVGTMRAS